MTILKAIILAIAGTSLSIHAISQDSLYAKKIDSLWLHSYNKNLLLKKREVASGIKIEYSYYKSSRTIRSITISNKSARENLLFFFLEDKIVMISPSGQQPYFILDDQVAYAKQLRHTARQIQRFITRAYDYLQQAYLKTRWRKNIS